MRKKSKRLVVIVCILIVLALILPISNLIVGHKPNRLTSVETDDPLFARACAIMAKKCVNCHTAEPQLPFYARFPVAQQIIEEDMEKGYAYIDLVSALLPVDNQPVSEVVLAKLEFTTLHNTMPPLRYKALHWDSGVSAAEQKDILAWIRQVRRKHYGTPGAAPEFRDEVVQPIPQTVEPDARKVALGNELYHDTRLSKDGTLACASCHELNKGGTDRAQVSTGVAGAKGGINSPTVYNSGYQFMLFWDGRAPTLEEQAKGPVENPIEMAAKWPDVIKTLQGDAELVDKFKPLYPEGISVETVVDAIATFERSLITPNSRFDKYLMGKADAITADEKKGYQLFKDSGCAMCHVGKILGGQSFEKMGRTKDYFADRGNVSEPDYGRFNATKKDEDRYKFKVPTLRNIALTGPYLHEGSTNDLGKIVRLMAEYQVGKDLSDRDTKLIEAFLKTLTGEYEGKLLQ